MGIPSFFREIVDNYQETYFWDPKLRIDYFLIDYNAVIYTHLRSYFKRIAYSTFQKMTVAKRDAAIIKFVVQQTVDFVNNKIKPQKLLFLAIDGPAPRSKMNLQRFRRYKGIKKSEYVKGLHQEFNISDPSSLWSSNKISPGTTFMEKLSKALWKAVEKKKFMKGKINVILSDSNRAGEGEHKLIPFLRSLSQSEDHICISSPDADLFVLTMGLVKKKKIYILRDKDENVAKNKSIPEEADYVFVDMSKYVDVFLHKHQLNHLDKKRFARDLMFISFFGGNDFVRPIPFLITRKRGLEKIANAYKRVSNRYQRGTRKYLVEIRKKNGRIVPTVNPSFFKDLLIEFARMEENQMRKQYERILSCMERKQQMEEKITFEEQLTNFEHRPYYSQSNPYYSPQIFQKINYLLPKKQWKNQYYVHFFGLSPDNREEYQKFKKVICQMFLQSLAYTLQYYLTGVPSWTWNYPFRVAPFPSDLLYFLNTVPNDLDFTFELGRPYTPIEQLVFIQPPQTADIIPRPARKLMIDVKSPLLQFFPIGFDLDVLAGEKFIYSEPILPEMVDEMILPVLEEVFKKLTASEKKRNTLLEKDQVYESKDQKELKKLLEKNLWEKEVDQVGSGKRRVRFQRGRPRVRYFK